MTIKGCVELDIDGHGYITLSDVMDRVHLCKYCDDEFGECTGKALYGTGHGNDNVWHCTGFK